jgi:predicted nucleic acid-binding protein
MRLHALPTWWISAVGCIELAQGCRDKADLPRLKKGLAARITEIVPVTPAISQRASALIDELALSHGLRLADALESVLLPSSFRQRCSPPTSSTSQRSRG